MRSNIGTITRKEFSTYFSSPIAFIFLGTFSAVCLFIFFWVEKFFARNIVDARPLFEWMPILLIFLSAALTMKMWSEERRMGTLEFLLTMPVRIHQLVIGKFLACLGLVIVALLLTLGVPVSVSFMGSLDWGPVLGAYIASLLLASAYIAIGLYISSKNENQIVSLILTTVVCYVFFLVGSDTLSSLVGNRWAEYLRLVATGSRFESITRGVLDVRDIYYYVSIVGVFLTLNIFALEKLRWSAQGQHAYHRRWRVLSALVIVNLLLANLWLYRGAVARADLTEGDLYSISDATRGMLAQLQEPLLIRGYFSAKTHPLLAPLVPRIRDTIREYAAVSDGKVRAEFVDPREDPDLEEQANRQFNIRPTPFQIADRYQSSLVNSYFDVLLQYGDKHEVLRFQDLIEVKPTQTRLDVRLRNLEYDLTRSIKKVLYGFQGVDALFAGIDTPVTFQGFISADDQLTQPVAVFKGELLGLLKELEQRSGGKFRSEVVDPQADGGAVATQIAQQYGFRPMVSGLFNPKQFYFYMVMKNNGQTVRIPFPQELTKEAAERSIEAALKRFSPGFLKTVGFHSPQPPQPQNPMMRQQRVGRQFLLLQHKLRENYQIQNVDLKNGIVPDNIDLLVIAAPKDLDTKQLFAIDQFIMRGGAVVLLTSAYTVTREQSGLMAVKEQSGLEPMLESYGVRIEEQLVLDPQNEPYPVPVNRKVGGFTVQEIQMVPYPYFVDVRGKGLNEDNAITARLPQVTVYWGSPVSLLDAKKAAIAMTPLLTSSEAAWLSEATAIQPDFKRYPKLGFARNDKIGARTLAMLIEGSFESFFKGKPSPLLEEKPDASAEAKPDEADGETEQKDEEEDAVVSGTIEKSPASARIIIVASNESLADQTLQIARAAGGQRFLNSLEFIENAVDWSLEDRALLSIRSRGHFSRTLIPTTEAQKAFWEYFNYAIVVLGLLLIYGFHRFQKQRVRNHYQTRLAA